MFDKREISNIVRYSFDKILKYKDDKYSKKN